MRTMADFLFDDDLGLLILLYALGGLNGFDHGVGVVLGEQLLQRIAKICTKS